MLISTHTIILEHSIYGFFSIANDYAFDQNAFGFILFLSCTIFLNMEDSLGNLLSYEEEEEEEENDKDGSTMTASKEASDDDTLPPPTPVFLFGIIDEEILTCFKFPMTLTCGRCSIHFVRLLYYNLHGLLFTIAWCGLDSTLGILSPP